MTPAIPPEIQAIIDRLVAQGAEVEVIPVPGKSIVFSGESVGAGQVLRGDNAKGTVSGEPAVVDALTGSASSGASSWSWSADAFTGPAGANSILLIAGLAVCGIAAWMAKGGRLSTAAWWGACGVAAMIAAFNQWVLWAALALLVVALLATGRDSKIGRAIRRAYVDAARIIETDAPELKTKIKATTPDKAKKAAGAELKREGVS